MKIAWKIIKWTLIVLWNVIAVRTAYLIIGIIYNKMRCDAMKGESVKPDDARNIRTTKHYVAIMYARAKAGWNWYLN